MLNKPDKSGYYFVTSPSLTEWIIVRAYLENNILTYNIYAPGYNLHQFYASDKIDVTSPLNNAKWFYIDFPANSIEDVRKEINKQLLVDKINYHEEQLSLLRKESLGNTDI